MTDPDQPVATDWLLQSLVDIANTGGLSFPITLQVGGVLVSGILMSGKRYFEEFAQKMGTTVVEDDQDEIVAFFQDLGKSFYAAPTGETPRTPPHFLHLCNVKIFKPDGQPFPIQDGEWWRGRLEAVDGFMLGSLTMPMERPAPITED